MLGSELSSEMDYPSAAKVRAARIHRASSSHTLPCHLGRHDTIELQRRPTVNPALVTHCCAVEVVMKMRGWSFVPTVVHLRLFTTRPTARNSGRGTNYEYYIGMEAIRTRALPCVDTRPEECSVLSSLINSNASLPGAYDRYYRVLARVHHGNQGLRHGISTWES